jgi:hypothetical protein
MFHAVDTQMSRSAGEGRTGRVTLQTSRDVDSLEIFIPKEAEVRSTNGTFDQESVIKIGTSRIMGINGLYRCGG